MSESRSPIMVLTCIRDRATGEVIYQESEKIAGVVTFRSRALLTAMGLRHLAIAISYQTPIDVARVLNEHADFLEGIAALIIESLLHRCVTLPRAASRVARVVPRGNQRDELLYRTIQTAAALTGRSVWPSVFSPLSQRRIATGTEIEIETETEMKVTRAWRAMAILRLYPCFEYLSVFL
jgi:hypothetical protein